MLFDELKKQLSEMELSALDFLENCGYQIMTETRLDDCKKKDGKRVRTFSLRGRYDLVIALKSVHGRCFPASTDDFHPADDEPDLQDRLGAEVSEKIKVGAEDYRAFPPENFWLDRERWFRMSRKGFYVLVVEEALDDLRAAPAEIQEEVKEKFLRFFDPKEWPI